jgi:S-DNA-T family DNA segregation ATPase FtsK/SpoIIIE
LAKANNKAKKMKPGESVLGVSSGHALREGALWVFGALALILFGALVSYHPEDPGFSFTGSTQTISNAIGPVGAYLADVFFLLFGRPAYLFPVMLAYCGWLVFANRSRPEGLGRREFALRLGGFALTLVTSCGLATLHFSPEGLPHTGGGVLGALFGQALAGAISFLGATLLMLALWLAGVSLFAGVSWLAIMDRVGRMTLSAVDAVIERIQRFRTLLEGRKAAKTRH